MLVPLPFAEVHASYGARATHWHAPMGNSRPRRPLFVRKPVALMAWPPMLAGTAMRPCQRSVSATSSCPSAAGAGTNQVARARTPRGAWHPASGALPHGAPAAGVATSAALVDGHAAWEAEMRTDCAPRAPLAPLRSAPPQGPLQAPVRAQVGGPLLSCRGWQLLRRDHPRWRLCRFVRRRALANPVPPPRLL